jgi:thiol-disulfide isomerase/thioredoxin
MKKTLIMLIAFFTLNTNLIAKDMEMIDTDGKTYKVIGEKNSLKIEGMEGKVVFLELFGLKCPACKEAMPHLINLQNKYKNKLQVMAIEVQKNDIKPINAYKKEHGINYITLSNYDVGFVVRYITEKSKWKGEIPFVVAIDSKGDVKFAQSGMLPEKALENYIQEFSKKAKIYILTFSTFCWEKVKCYLEPHHCREWH